MHFLYFTAFVEMQKVVMTGVKFNLKAGTVQQSFHDPGHCTQLIRDMERKIIFTARRVL
jgi:hypothetical protein